MEKIMKTITSYILSCLSLMTLSLTMHTAIADPAPHTSGVSMQTILQNLEKAGYHAIQEVEYDDGVFEAKAINQNGAYAKIILDPNTGAILSPTQTSSQGISMLDAVKAVETAGYTRIHDIESKTHHYEIEAFNQSGHKVKLNVDASTGKLSQAWD
jgi:hypothetical protein